jgi:alpha-D-ribose 1-methylphosphonate 5-triphosphate synthase subunit PhnH
MGAHAFADPVFDAQRVFRAAMNALARPGSVQALGADIAPPAPLTPELAALALALSDHETPVWLDAALAGAAEVADYLRFHTGAPITLRPREALFALVSDPALCPSLQSFALGIPDYPDRSTTLFLQVETLRASGHLTLRGPGIAGTAACAAEPLPPAFLREWSTNRALFPRGVDVLLVADGAISGLPRTTEIVEGRA